MKKFLKEFKEFAVKGNVVDLAVGVVVGGAFNTIVKSLVDDVIMPLVGILMGGYDFASLSLKINEASINYGNLIQNIVNFLITAFSIFVVIKAINAMKRKKEEEPKEEEPAPKPDDIVLLEQIKDAIIELKDSDK